MRVSFERNKKGASLGLSFLPNSILLVCTTLFLIIPVNLTYAKEKLSQEPVSIGKKGLNKPIADTGQVRCYNNSRKIPCPKPGQPFYGQDAQYDGNVPSYRNNGDGTVTGLNTGLMWSKAEEILNRVMEGDMGMEKTSSRNHYALFTYFKLEPTSMGFGQNRIRLKTKYQVNGHFCRLL